jgi:SAM-dependent methyltransferase
LDLHTRDRASLCVHWKTGSRDVLDAGSGNGYFAWLAYESGARVVAMNIDSSQVEKSADFLVRYRRADPARLRFEQCNLYHLTEERRTFDEIICYETLEHVRHDRQVVEQFYRILRPGGVLHLCCPHRLHPRHQEEVLDADERGGHVRAGYTADEYGALLRPVGFEIETIVGIGATSVYVVDGILRAIRNRVGDALALPLLPVGLLILRTAKPNPPLPFSLYVKARKPSAKA